MRKAQNSPRVWTCLRFARETKENWWKTKGIQGLSFLYSMFYIHMFLFRYPAVFVCLAFQQTYNPTCPGVGEGFGDLWLHSRILPRQTAYNTSWNGLGSKAWRRCDETNSSVVQLVRQQRVWTATVGRINCFEGPHIYIYIYMYNIYIYIHNIIYIYIYVCVCMHVGRFMCMYVCMPMCMSIAWKHRYSRTIALLVLTLDLCRGVLIDLPPWFGSCVLIP